MLGAELGHHTDNVSTAVLSEGTGDNLNSGSEGLEGPLHNTLDVLRVLLESASDLHLDGTTTGNELGVNHNVTGYTKSIVEVSLDLIKDVLRGTSEENRASLGVLALSHEGEVVITDLLDLEETALCADIGLLKLLRAVSNSGTTDTGNTIVVGFTDTTDDCAVTVLEEEVLSGITDTLLGDDNVGLDSEDVFAHLLDFLLFSHESLLEIVFLGELHVGHGLTLLVLEGAIKEDNTGVLDHTSHAGVSNILVEHNTGEDFALLKETTWDLLNLSVSLHIDLDMLTLLTVDSLDGLDSEVNNKVAPLG